MDWSSRFLDDPERGSSRVCLLTDFVPALRIVGAMNSATRELWNRYCVTCDPLTQPSQAVSMVRAFLDAVVAELPEDGLAQPLTYHLDDEEARIAASRRTWASSVLEAVLGMPMGQLAVGATETVSAASSPVIGADTAVGTMESTMGVGTTVVHGTGELEGVEPPASDEVSGNVEHDIVEHGEVLGPGTVSSVDLTSEAVVPEVEIVHEDPPVVVPVAGETVTVTDDVGSGPNLGGHLVGVRQFPPDGISMKLVAKVASSRRPMDGSCLAEIAEMALNDRIFSSRRLTGSRKRELDPLNPPCDGTLQLCRELVRDNFVKHGLIGGQVVRVDVRVIVGRVDVGACPVVVLHDMTCFDMLTQVVLFLATGFGVPPLPFKVVQGAGETGVALDLGAKLVDYLRFRQEVLVYCNPPVHIRSQAGDFARGQPVRGEASDKPVRSVRHSGEGSTAQGSDAGEVGGGLPSEPWSKQLSVGDLAAFTPQGQQSIHYLKSVFGQVTAAVFHVKLPDDRDLAFDIAQVDGSIAVLVHRIALEMKQSVSMFGSPSHAGWHLQVKDSIETDGATIFLMAFTFLHPGSVVEPVQGKQKRRRSPSPGSKPSGSRPVFGNQSHDKSRRVRSKRTARGGNQGGDGGKGTRGRTTAVIGYETGGPCGNLDHPMVDELDGDELHVSRFFGCLMQQDDFDSEAALALSQAFELNGREGVDFQVSNVGCIGHGIKVGDFSDSKGEVSPTLPFDVVTEAGTGFPGARDLKGNADALCVLLPIVKACVDTNTFIDQAKTVVCTEDTWVAVPESYIGALP